MKKIITIIHFKLNLKFKNKIKIKKKLNKIMKFKLLNLKMSILVLKNQNYKDTCLF